MLRNTKGFTFIELLVVVAVLGILAAIALPRFSSTRDKARLAALRSDIGNVELAEEVYFSDFASYGTLAELQAASTLALSPGTALSITPARNGYTVAANNPAIATGITSCTVQIAAGAAAAIDGKVNCQ